MEIDHMLVGKRPVDAMSYIRDLGLFDVVFYFPKKCDPPHFDNWDRCCVSHIEAAWNLAISVNSGISHHMLMDGQPRLYLYSALLFPLRKMFYLDKKSKIHVTSYIIQESLKLDACLSKSVESIHGASGKFAKLVLLFESNDIALGTLKEELDDVYLDIPTDSLKRVFAGLILDEIKDLWRVALLISMLSYLEAENAGDTISQQNELHWRREKYIEVERFISGQGLDGVWKWKPLLNGDAIMDVMQFKRGPLVGEWKRRVFKWQLAHPKGTVDDCIDWMK
ncbi:hypothetical protein EJB05_33436 [Eragrostis curvula]|uniref:Uncharacterized protein n=1 Tax=Eragrostis curvula TaxID=38414 RepID=A0A5J9U2W9_9POAL|nr:hypothetical protein EJB05_33436 [Eragrostis curvula]